MLSIYIDNLPRNGSEYVYSNVNKWLISVWLCLCIDKTEKRYKQLYEDLKMSDFSKSMMYSGLVLVAGLIAIFSISSNMSADPSMDASGFAVIEPAAGDEASMPMTDEMAATADDVNSATVEALTQLRKALEDAGVDVSDIEPAAGDMKDAAMDVMPSMAK